MGMSQEVIDKHLEAGKIAKEVKNDSINDVEPGMKVVNLVKLVEERIKDRGADIAFPCNVSINEVAAHYTSPKDDETKIEKGDYLKLDLGVHVEGYIADTATTTKVGEEKDELMESAEQGLEEAKKQMKPGNVVGEIGGKIENTIKSYGFSPIINLSGHKMERYDLHTGVSLPNIKSNSQYELKEGDVFAIEPFSTPGDGKVKEGTGSYIMNLEKERSVRMKRSREILEYLKNRKSLPFAERWIYEKFPGGKTKISLKKLIDRDIIHPYRVLIESSGENVAQFEDTVIVKDEPIVTTK